ncbi:c56ff4a8-c9ac-42ce-ba92-4096ea274d23 [Thermothielavioides terrestris]|uniref:Mitochondrial import inner membrane translocase subunit n=1 Tax=Thermothielavioides terrestris TaxID=2587410 RepID=A0A446BIT7_9PEZI|nr:c56ff4a8-c9ac-42ce-ba92-4096ea274d23 [Thermothielavioides terrestris]
MDSEAVKKAIIRQALQATNTANARTLIEAFFSHSPSTRSALEEADLAGTGQNINEKCFERCVPKPGSSLSSSEQTCLTQCMEKYMAAWNIVNATYIQRIQQEIGNQSITNA